uniref:Uncharacterized protein n=1 Tax=Tetranychus urticae TaxID=32264 RepID=T1KWE7_TETUR
MLVKKFALQETISGSSPFWNLEDLQECNVYLIEDSNLSGQFCNVDRGGDEGML